MIGALRLKWIHSKRKEFAPHEEKKKFLLEQTPLQMGLVIQEGKEKVSKDDCFVRKITKSSMCGHLLKFNPTALRMAKTQLSFGHSECSRVKQSFTICQMQKLWDSTITLNFPLKQRISVRITSERHTSLAYQTVILQLLA